MRKLNLANLAQNEIKKDDADKIKGGICFCNCLCDCVYDEIMDLRWEFKLEDRAAIA